MACSGRTSSTFLHYTKGAMLIWEFFVFYMFVFLVFRCFPCYVGIFLSFCYIFLSVFSVFFDFVVSSSQFPMHFAIFRVAVSQISRFLQFFACFSPFCYLMLYNFEILRSFLPLGYILLSCGRFSADSMSSFDFTAFWFHCASMLHGSGWQTGRKT